MLAAFGLRHDFEVADLSIYTWSGCGIHRDLCEVVMQSLVELAEAHPEAVQLMRGRTFARTVH